MVCLKFPSSASNSLKNCKKKPVMYLYQPGIFQALPFKQLGILKRSLKLVVVRICHHLRVFQDIPLSRLGFFQVLFCSPVQSLPLNFLDSVFMGKISFPIMEKVLLQSREHFFKLAKEKIPFMR